MGERDALADGVHVDLRPADPLAARGDQLGASPGRWPNALLFGLGKLAVGKWAKPVKELRESLGLAAAGHPMYEGQFSPQLVLAAFSPLLGEPQPDWPSQLVQTGFLPFDGSHTGDESSAALSEFFAAGEPPVVLTLGTSSVTSSTSFYEDGNRAAQSLGLRCVLVGDDSVAPLARGGGALHVRAAPFGMLFPRARVVIHPGGAGTSGWILASGRPSLLVPFAHDQLDNAARLAKLGVGRVISLQKCDEASLRRELEVLLKPCWTQQAVEVSELVSREPGVEGACDALEALRSG